MAPGKRNIRLTIAYDGTHYSGWQIQRNAPTIQGELERVLGVITNSSVSLHGAGRTDAGVHALAMVANFHTLSPLPCQRLQEGLNSMLPRDIRILAAEEADPAFHARFSAHSKTYFYAIETGRIQSPIHRLYAVHVPFSLDLPAMEQCLAQISGTHDFASFEAAGSRDLEITTGRGSVRTLHQAKLLATGTEAIRFTFTGDGFLRHMVRNIVGTVLEVGKGRKNVTDFTAIVQARKRSAAGATAPAHGLFLEAVHYQSP